MQNYVDFDSDDYIPDGIVDAFVNKIVASKDGFDWYLRCDSEKAQRYNVTGRRGAAQVASPVFENPPFTTMRRRQRSKKANNCRSDDRNKIVKEIPPSYSGGGIFLYYELIFFLVVAGQ